MLVSIVIPKATTGTQHKNYIELTAEEFKNFQDMTANLC